MRISPLSIQQGLFVCLALLVTLLAGQQFLRWEQSRQPAPPSVVVPQSTQTHISPVSRLADSAPIRVMEVDRVRPVLEPLPQERWVF